MSPLRLARLAALALVFALPLSVGAQPVFGTYNPDIDMIREGVAFRMYAEPGAPTIDVIVAELDGPAAYYRVGEETTLTEILALSGNYAGDRESERQLTTSSISVLRGNGAGGREVIYSASGAELLREPGRHPQLLDGDIVEIQRTYERVNRITLREGLQIATSSLALLVGILNLLR